MVQERTEMRLRSLALLGLLAAVALAQKNGGKKKPSQAAPAPDEEEDCNSCLCEVRDAMLLGKKGFSPLER